MTMTFIPSILGFMVSVILTAVLYAVTIDNPTFLRKHPVLWCASFILTNVSAAGIPLMMFCVWRALSGNPLTLSF